MVAGWLDRMRSVADDAEFVHRTPGLCLPDAVGWQGAIAHEPSAGSGMHDGE